MKSFRATLQRLPFMLTCREVEVFLLDYVEGSLAPYKRFKFEMHLKVCPECRDYLAAYRKSIELGQKFFGAPDEPMPADIPEDLVKAIVDSRDTVPSSE